jgi:hypothetical protein
VPHGGARHLAARRAQEGGDRRQPLVAPDQALEALADADAEEIRRHLVVHQHPPLAVERHDARGDVLDHPLDDLLFAQQVLSPVGDAPRHVVDRRHQRRQLELGGGQIERAGAGGDAARPLDELGDRTGEVLRQAGADRAEQREEAGGHQDGVAPQVDELARRLLLLGEERHRDEQVRLAVRVVARQAERRVQLEIGHLGGLVDQGVEIALAERQARVDLAR